MILFVLLLFPALVSAASLQWGYDTTDGKQVPATSTVKKKDATGTTTNAAVVPSLPSAWVIPYPPDGATYWIENAGGMSNQVQYLATTPPPYDDTALKASIAALESKVAKLQSQMAGICRAAKAMGGTATSLAGRLRKEIPCV